MRRRIDALIAKGLPAERIGGDQQINHIRFDNGASIILAAVMRLELINDWVGHQSGLLIADETIEIHKGGRTGKDALVKLTARPTFDGKIKAGKEYKLIGDAIAQGGTISELRHLVDNAGAKAVNVSIFAAAQYSAVIAPSDETIQKIEEKFGREKTETFLRDYDIAGSLEALTEREQLRKEFRESIAYYNEAFGIKG